MISSKKKYFTIPEVKEQEEWFIEQCRKKIEHIKEIYNPLTQKKCSFKKNISFKRRNDDGWLKKLRDKYNEYQKKLPQNMSLEVAIEKKHFMGKVEKIFIIAAVMSPLEEAIKEDACFSPLSVNEIKIFIKKLGITKDAFFYIGIYSITGWKKGVENKLPQDDNFSIILLEKDGMHWKYFGDKRDFVKQTVEIFDPRSTREKINNAILYIQNIPRLQIRGGYVIIDELINELGLSKIIMKQVLSEVIAKDPDIYVEDIDNALKIIKRKRFS